MKLEIVEVLGVEEEHLDYCVLEDGVPTAKFRSIEEATFFVEAKMSTEKDFCPETLDESFIETDQIHKSRSPS